MDTERGTTSRPFLVTGCGRSGTQYTARLLSAAGLACSHERLFTGRIDDQVDHGVSIAESSWLAAPFLDKLPSEALVLHQIRNPMAVVVSYVARGFFDLPAFESPLWKHILKRAMGRVPSGQYRLVTLVRDVLPQVFQEKTPIQRAARFWIEWNSLVEERCRFLGLERLMYRIEDVGPEFLASVVQRITGAQLPPGIARAAVHAVPTNANTGPPTVSVSLDQLGALRTPLVAKADSYGYRLIEGSRSK